MSGIYYPFKTRLDEGHVWGKDSPLIKGDDHEAYTSQKINNSNQPDPGCSTKMSREQHRHQWTVFLENQKKQKTPTKSKGQHFG